MGFHRAEVWAIAWYREMSAVVEAIELGELYAALDRGAL